MVIRRNQITKLQRTTVRRKVTDRLATTEQPPCDAGNDTDGVPVPDNTVTANKTRTDVTSSAIVGKTTIILTSAHTRK